jgi:hypothetical protein
MMPKLNATNNCCIRSDCHAFPYVCLFEGILAFYRTQRIDHICKYHRRAQEDIIFDFYALLYRNIVLDLHPIANTNTRTDKDILSKNTSLSNDCTGHDMTKVPDIRSGSQCRAVIYDSSGVYNGAVHL